VLVQKGVNTFFVTLLVNKNLAIVADLSNSSSMMVFEGLPEEVLMYILEMIFPHCYRVTEQGVILMEISVIDELRMYDLPKNSKSTANFINGLLNFVDDVIDKKKSVDPNS